MNLLISFTLGMLPEILFYYFYIKEIKDVKNKKLILLLGITIIYILSMIIPRNFYIYLAFDVVIYFLLKLIYKSEIIDYFIIIFLEIYLLSINYLSFYIVDNYIIAYIINRLLMFIPLLFRKKLKKFYINYRRLWNRNDNDKERKIKSITLRNISLILLDMLIVTIYLTLIYNI